MASPRHRRVRWQFGSSISFGFGRHAIVTGDRGDDSLKAGLWVAFGDIFAETIQQTEKASSEVLGTT
jgi:hypothetical protein